MYNDKAYEFINNRATQVNNSVPLRAVSRAGIYKPYAVSIFGSRAIFSYYDTMFIFNITTRTWTTWKSPLRGPIGKVVTLQQNNQFAQAICHGSSFIPASTGIRTNLLNNPSARRGIGAITSFGGTLVSELGLDVYSSATGVSSPGNFGITLETPTVGGGKLSANTQYTFSASIYGSNVSLTLTVNGTGVVGSSVQSITQAAGGGFLRQSVTFTTTSTGTVNFYVLNASASVAASIISFRDAQLEVGAVATTYFDGAGPDTILERFVWSGTADNSTSTATVRRYAKTLRITDGLTTDAEAFTCTLLTKNYNYNTSGSYKRLFYWGADAVFRSNVTAIVTPIVYNYAVTWGQMLAFTWGSARNFTWAQPISGTIAVTTVRSTSGGGAIRKFVKFDKSLRFRQANFKLIFDTDGSTSSAPVRIFSLMTYVKVKERVVQTVT